MIINKFMQSLKLKSSAALNKIMTIKRYIHCTKIKITKQLREKYAGWYFSLFQSNMIQI